MFKDPIQKLNKLYYHWKRGRWIINPKTYLGNYENIPTDRPIFLLGVQCGGLTLVSRMLRRHPSVVSVTGNYRYWSGADEMHTVLGPMLPAELSGCRYKVPNSKHPLFYPPRSWTYACNELLPYYRRTALDANAELKRKFKRIIQMIIAKHAIDKHNARFTDKSQVYTVRVSLISELLRKNNPKFILIVMNPYALCYKAANGKAADMVRLKKKLSPEERLNICAQHWANSMKCALEDRKQNMLIIRFEDILQDPITYMRKICKFAELNFNEDMLPQPNHKIPFGSRFPDRWYPFEPERSQNYLQKIGKKEIEIISKYCKNLALHFGYHIP